MAAYVPTRLIPIGGGRWLLYVAGQVPTRDGRLMTGRVPLEVSLEEAQEAARRCALNVLAQIEAAAGLDRVEQVAQLTGWVLCTDDFEDQPAVLNAASQLFESALGAAGKHTRAAVGASALPRGATVELAAVVIVGSE